jgi:hypothetical protein
LRSIYRTIYKQTRVCKITMVFLFQLLQFDYEVWEIIIYFTTCFSFLTFVLYWFPTKNLDRSWTIGSRKSLSKYLMDTIDFNKHDIDIFINLAMIVHYGRHWDESCNLYILTATFPMRNCAHMMITKICPL